MVFLIHVSWWKVTYAMVRFYKKFITLALPLSFYIYLFHSLSLFVSFSLSFPFSPYLFFPSLS